MVKTTDLPIIILNIRNKKRNLLFPTINKHYSTNGITSEYRRTKKYNRRTNKPHASKFCTHTASYQTSHETTGFRTHSHIKL
jgi:hypothetical protein